MLLSCRPKKNEENCLDGQSDVGKGINDGLLMDRRVSCGGRPTIVEVVAATHRSVITAQFDDDVTRRCAAIRPCRHNRVMAVSTHNRL